MRTLEKTLSWGRNSLREHKIENGDQEAWYLLEYVLKIDRNYYFMHQDDIIEENDFETYRSLIQRRNEHVPLQQLTGEAYFMGLPFLVTPHVLIPRQDTEILVETGLERAASGWSILDVCTGSGCIILSMMHYGKDLQGTACDISGEALKVARENAERIGLSVEFKESDLFSDIRGKYDMILSNPPYIKKEVIPTLMEEVRKYEPILALDGGIDGLDFYRRIVREGENFLKDEGWMGFEIGYDQGTAVRDILESRGWREIEIIKDLAGMDRVVWAKHPQQTGGKNV